MDNTTDRYAELMHRRELLFADWMRRRESCIEGLEFFGSGIVLGKRGQLRMTAFDQRSKLPLWELSMDPGDTQVRITFPDKTTYLV